MDDLGFGVFFVGITAFAVIMIVLAIKEPDMMREAIKVSEGSWIKETVTKEKIKEEGYTVSVDDNNNVKLTNDETGEVIETEGITINNNGTLNITINIENIENIENMTLSDLLQYVEGSQNP